MYLIIVFCVYACVPEYMSKHHMPARALRGQKRTLNFLYLEFSSRVDAGSQILDPLQGGMCS